MSTGYQSPCVYPFFELSTEETSKTQGLCLGHFTF